MTNVSRRFSDSSIPQQPSVPGGLTPPPTLTQSRQARTSSTGTVSFTEQGQLFNSSPSLAQHHFLPMPNLAPSPQMALTGRLSDEQRAAGRAMILPPPPASIAANGQAHQQQPVMPFEPLPPPTIIESSGPPVMPFEPLPPPMIIESSGPPVIESFGPPVPQPSSSWVQGTPQQTIRATPPDPHAPQPSLSTAASHPVGTGTPPTPGTVDPRIAPPHVDPHASGAATPPHSADPTNPTPAASRIDPNAPDPAQQAKKSFWTAQKTSIVACIGLCVLGAALSATGYGAIVGVPMIFLGLAIGYYFNRKEVNAFLLAAGKGTVELGKAAGKGAINAAIGLWDKISDRFDKDKSSASGSSRHRSASIDSSRPTGRSSIVDDDLYNDDDHGGSPAPGGTRPRSASIDPSRPTRRDSEVDDPDR